jgi:hypothetical protein
MFRTAAAVVLSALVLATSAAAADAVNDTNLETAATATGVARLNPGAQAVFSAAPTAGALNLSAPLVDKRPAALMSMYAALAGLQAYDFYSTTAALKNGAREANPIMSGVVATPGAFLAVKAGVTGVSIFAAERMWRQHHRAQAIAVMAVSNGFMAFVAAHNHAVVSATR